MSKLVAAESLDVLCVQEHKLQEVHVKDVAAALGINDWSLNWTCSTAKLGYSGVATFSREAPLRVTRGIGVREHDQEGRVVSRVCGVWGFDRCDLQARGLGDGASSTGAGNCAQSCSVAA